MLVLIGKQGKFFKEHFISEKMIKGISEKGNMIFVDFVNPLMEEMMMYIARFTESGFCVWFCEKKNGEWEDNFTYLERKLEERDQLHRCDHHH